MTEPATAAAEGAPMDDKTVFAIVPDRHGWTVVPVADLLDRLDDGEPLTEALTNAGIESGMDRELPALVKRVRALNVTGDLETYWGRTDGD